MKKLFEWVVSCRGEEFILTEAQHQFLKNNQDKKSVDFDDFTLQPAMVEWTRKRPAQELMKMYPCKICHSSGYMADRSTCENCDGTGVDLK